MNSDNEALIWDEALDWSIRINAPQPDESLQAQLLLWIGQSHAHAAAWRKAEQSWQLMGAVAPVHQHRWPAAPEAALEPARARRSWRLGAGIASAMAACLLIAISPFGLWLRADQATRTGEIRRIALADGSVVHLDSGSAVNIDYAGDRRRVTLVAGRAFFDVKKDKARPFSVHADGADVTVLGTAFDVGLQDDTVDVTVERGLVSVAPEAAGASFRLKPGERASVDRGNGRLAMGTIAPVHIAPWRDGQIAVDGATVGAVVAELRRYHGGIIILRDDRLAKQPVTGVYDVRDPVAALNAIILPYRGKVTGIGDYFLFVSIN